MDQYISKSALVAELKKRIKETESMQPKFDQFWAGQISAFKGVLKILDTIETKEVDLEKEWDKCCENCIFDDESEVYTARRFFELGFKAQKGE